MATTTTSPTISILMKEKTGLGIPQKKGENSWQCKVDKGELLVEIPERDRAVVVEKLHNYKLYSDPEVTLYASPTDAIPLKDEELMYLLAVTPPSVRLQEYIRLDKVKEKMELVVGDTVVFKMRVKPTAPDDMIKGVIRYIGPLEESEGMYFGIEIVEEKFHGKGTTNGRPHFSCNKNNGVFVSMDKIVKKSQYIPPQPQRQSSKPDIPSSSVTYQPTANKDKPSPRSPTGTSPSDSAPAQNTRSQLSKLGDKVKEVAATFTQPVSIEVDHDIHHDQYSHPSQFKPGHRVVLQSAKDTVIHGTVRWVGPVRVSADRREPLVPVVGVETDKKVNPKEHFPELHVNVSGSHGQDLFTVSPNHGRVYLPEQLVVHADDFTKQQEDLQMEQGIAKQYGLSVDEYRSQKKYLDQANADRDARLYRLQTVDPSIGNEEELMLHVGAGMSGGGKKDERNVHDLNKLIKHLQTEKESVKEEKMSLEKLHEQITNENKSLKREKEQLSTEKEQLRREHYQLKGEKLQLYKEKRQLEEVNYYLQEDKRQLEEDKWQLEREYHQLQEDHHRITDQYTNLSTAHSNLQREMREKDNVHSQVQTRRAQLEIETMRLKGQVRQLEESSVSDIKYWEISYEQVTTNGVELGRGGWGKVLVGLVNGQKVAIKMLHSDIVSPHYNQLVRREITMMAKVRHPNLILFMGGVLDHPSGAPIIITELLDTSLRKAYKDGLVRNDDVKLSILRDVAAALNYLHCHRERIIHRDVSSANVLLESKGHGNYWRGKLSDFGSANLVQYSMTTGPGAVPYTAPEVPQTQTTKMDVYSYGILLCEVMTGQFPFRESFPSMLQSLSNIHWIYTLVIDCTKHTRTDRPDMRHVLCVFDEQYDDGEMKINITEFKPLPL